MRIRNGFILRRMPEMNLVMPAGTMTKEYHKTVILNDTAAFLFELLQQREETVSSLTEALLREYDVDESRAAAAAESAVSDFREAGLLEE